MANKKYLKQFKTVGEQINSAKNMNDILQMVSELDRITKILQRGLPEFRDVCYCGAIDYPNDLIVIYTINSGAFHLLNNQIALIQDCLESNGVRFSKILLKNRPQTIKAKPKPKPPISQAQRQMLKKFAEAINRPDLLKEEPSDQDNPEDYPDWQIKL